MIQKLVRLPFAIILAYSPIGAFAQGTGSTGGGGAGGTAMSGTASSASTSLGARGGTTTGIPIAPGTNSALNSRGSSSIGSVGGTTTGVPEPLRSGSTSDESTSARSTGTSGTASKARTSNTSGQDQTHVPPLRALSAGRAGRVGTAPNGVPIGNPGSGPGSPEQPYDSGVRN